MKNRLCLELNGLPYRRPLFTKLQSELFDAGSFFVLVPSNASTGGYRKYNLHVKRESGVKAVSDVFLTDHAWEFAPELARKQLRDSPTLLKRMEVSCEKGTF